jgi:hypothetical protein
MPCGDESGVRYSGDHWTLLATWVERFESAWQRGEQPELADFLPADRPQRQAMLIALVHVVVKRRCREPFRSGDR